MKKRGAIYFLTLGILAIPTMQCSNDLDLLNYSSPIPVVYCQVNPSDSFCFVTLSKSFLEEGDFSNILQDTSRLKLNEAEVILEAWGSGYKLWETNFSLFNNKDPDNGFSNKARSVYRSDKMLLMEDPAIYNPHQKWDFQYFRLQVKSPELDRIAYSRISIIKLPVIWHSPPVRLSLYGEPESYFMLRIDLKEPPWFADLFCEFYFEEYIDKWEEKRIRFTIKEDIMVPTIEDKVIIRLTEEVLFNKVSVIIGNHPEVYSRRFSKMVFTFYVSDVYFHDYEDTYINASNLDMNQYSNIANGWGVFSVERSVQFKDLELDRQSLDSLCNGRLTRHLNFKLW